MNQVAVGRDTAPSLGLFPETFADSDQLYLRVVARYNIKPLNAVGISIIIITTTTPRDGRAQGRCNQEGARPSFRACMAGRVELTGPQPRGVFSSPRVVAGIERWGQLAPRPDRQPLVERYTATTTG